MTLDERVAITKDYFIKLNTAAYKAVVCSYFPFMGVPPVDKFTEWLCKKVATKVAEKVDNGIYFEVTDLRLDRQGDEYVKAKQSGDEERIKAAFRLVGRLNS